MRKNKFRIWDILSKRMLDWHHVWEMPVWGVFPGTPEQRHFALMQYRDIYSKEGDEICEGDILQVKGETDQPQGTLYHEVKGQVVVEKGMTYLVGKTINYIKEKEEPVAKDSKSLLLDSSIFSIIGNIFENEELLNE